MQSLQPLRVYPIVACLIQALPVQMLFLFSTLVDVILCQFCAGWTRELQLVWCFAIFTNTHEYRNSLVLANDASSESEPRSLFTVHRDPC